MNDRPGDAFFIVGAYGGCGVVGCRVGWCLHQAHILYIIYIYILQKIGPLDIACVAMRI